MLLSYPPIRTAIKRSFLSVFLHSHSQIFIPNSGRTDSSISAGLGYSMRCCSVLANLYAVAERLLQLAQTTAALPRDSFCFKCITQRVKIVESKHEEPLSETVSKTGEKRFVLPAPAGGSSSGGLPARFGSPVC